MMESSSSPGGSVLDRVLLFERKERESQLTPPQTRISTKSPRHELQPPFSPRRVLAAVPKDSVGLAMHYRGSTPTSLVNNLICDNIHSGYKLDRSPNSELTTSENLRTENPTSDRSTSVSRQDLTTNLKPGVTFGRSPRSDQMSSPKPVVSFGGNRRSDQTSPKVVVQLGKSPRSDQTVSPQVFAFSETHYKTEKSPSSRSYSSGSSHAPEMLPLNTDTCIISVKSPTSDAQSNYFKSVSFSQSTRRDTTITTPIKSPTVDQKANFQPTATSWKSPDHLSNFKPFPITSRAVIFPSKNDQPYIDAVPETSSVMSRAMTLRNVEPTLPLDQTSPPVSQRRSLFQNLSVNDQPYIDAVPETSSVMSRAMTLRNVEPTLPLDQISSPVSQRRSLFQNLSVSVSHNTDSVPLSVVEEAVIEEVSWPSEDLSSRKVATTRRKSYRENEDLTLTTEEDTVEEMPWPSEVLEEFPELSWISSDDDCIEDGYCSADKLSAEKHVALEERPAESNLTNGIETLTVHEAQRNTLPNDDDLFNKAQPIPADGTTSYARDSISTDYHASSTSTTTSNYISQLTSHSSTKPQQAYKTQFLPGKNVWHRNSKFQSSQSAFTSEDSVSDLQISSVSDADMFDAHHFKAPGKNLLQGSNQTGPLSIHTHHVKKHMQETPQERDEEAQQRSESPSRGTRYTSLSRVMHEDFVAADIDDSATVISSITAKSNVTISTEGSTGFTSRYCQLEEGLRQEVDSPSRTARMKRASRLKSLNSPISTNLLLEKSIELAVQVQDNRLPETSDLDGPPKITIEPGKLTAGCRPRSASPKIVASNQYSISKPPVIGSSNVNFDTWKEMSEAEADTSNVIADSADKSEDNHLASNMDSFCEGVLPRCREVSEELKNAKPAFNADDHLKETSPNHEVFKIPRSVSLRPELSNTLLGKSFARTPAKSLPGANSNEDDIHSVATDSTPITRPGRTFTAFEKTDESAPLQMASIIDLKNVQVPATSQHQQTKIKSLNSMKALNMSITDALIMHSDRDATLTLGHHVDQDGQRSNSSIHINAETVSIQNASYSPPLMLPQSSDVPSTPKKSDRRSQQISAVTLQPPVESLSQPVDYTKPHADHTLSNVDLNPREKYNEHRNTCVERRESGPEIKKVQIQEQQISLNRKKVNRKKSKKHVSLDSPSNRSASSSVSSANENNSVGSLSEDLASWWQSTYAAAQQPEVNHLIEQAILEKAVSPSSSTGKRRASILQTTHYQSSSSYRQPKSLSSGKSSSVVPNTISSTFLNSSTSCGNEGDSEGGSIGLLAGSANSSQTSRNSDSVGKGNIETDDDIFSGIEDDEQTLDSKLDKDNIDSKGGFKIRSLPGVGGGDISINDTSTCDDTHTTDILNSLDEDNSEIAKPSPVPLKPLRVKKVEGKSLKRTTTVPLEVDEIGRTLLLNRVPSKPGDGIQERNNKMESDDEMNNKTDNYEEISSGKSDTRASVNKMFEKFSCSFLEGFVVQLCQDPQKASSNFIEALFQNPEASTESDTGTGIRKEVIKNGEVESSTSLSDANDYPEQKNERSPLGKQVEKSDAPVTDKIQSEVQSREKKSPESFLDVNDIKKDDSSEEESCSKAVLPLPLTQSNASPKRMTFLSKGKPTTSYKVTPSSSAKSASSLVSARSSRAGQKQLLDRFCWKLLHDGMEVLKLNSDKIWQTRYLTVSQEVTWLSNEVVDGAKEVESSNFPKALLWVKKLTASKDQSVNGIEKNGKGGILFSHVACVEELNTGRHIPVSKKQLHGKFKNSVTVVLKSTDEGGSKIVYFRCGTRQEALVLCAGCNMISKLLQANKQPLLPLNNNKLPPSITSTSVEDSKPKAYNFESRNVEIEGDNDLWEV